MPPQRDVIATEENTRTFSLKQGPSNLWLRRSDLERKDYISALYRMSYFILSIDKYA